MTTHNDIRKVVLSYSGGLDSSVIVRWLQETYGCEVVTFTADLGQGEELEPARAKAEAMGVREIHIEDVREEFARDFVFPMFRANAVYEGEYLLGTSIARPLIAKRLVEIAAQTGADAISHGATGKGNDQVRFELGAYALSPDIRIIAPWREWDLTSRERLLAYAEAHAIPIEQKRGTKSPYSMDANLLHISYEGGPARGPLDGAGVGDVATDGLAGGGAERRHLPGDPLPGRRHRGRRRHGDDAGRGGHRAEPRRRRERRRPAGHRGEPLRGDEVAGLLRDARRDDHAEGAPGHRVAHAGPRGRPPQGRADAALRQPRLQRLLVEPGAADAPDGDRPLPAVRQRRGQG